MPKPITVKAEWDAEAGVWVASSDDVPGLVTEAETCNELVKKLQCLIPELLNANGLLSNYAETEIPFHLTTELDATAKLDRAC